MKIAVASGKGGTGKTMVATSLALTLSERQTVQFLDCDVEAPNAHLFLKPRFAHELPATLLMPQVDPDRCTACGRCVDVCAFSAMARIGTKILVFPQLCHGCGSCSRQCPEGAITEIPKPIGRLRFGTAAPGIEFFHGELTISEPMPTPIIRQLKQFATPDHQLQILDSPPGASCAVVATLKDVDFVILVTEPTPFGWHDLLQMMGILEQTGLPGGVIINRDGIGSEDIETRINETPFPILLKIPYRADVAAGLARGETLVGIDPNYRKSFMTIFEKITTLLEEQHQ